MEERKRTVMPCGHLMDYTEATRVVMNCELCDRKWEAQREHGVLEILREVK